MSYTVVNDREQAEEQLNRNVGQLEAVAAGVAEIVARRPKRQLDDGDFVAMSRDLSNLKARVRDAKETVAKLEPQLAQAKLAASEANAGIERLAKYGPSHHRDEGIRRLQKKAAKAKDEAEALESRIDRNKAQVATSGALAKKLMESEEYKAMVEFESISDPNRRVAPGDQSGFHSSRNPFSL